MDKPSLSVTSGFELAFVYPVNHIPNGNYGLPYGILLRSITSIWSAPLFRCI